ncbi:MAG: hypothetical protein WCJ95_15550 [Mariniphaga sp.]
MKTFNWNIQKNIWLKENRRISFEEIVLAIVQHRIKEVYDHPNQTKYPGQKIYEVEIDDYVFLIPFIESEYELFLKTIIPSRKATKKHK